MCYSRKGLAWIVSGLMVLATVGWVVGATAAEKYPSKPIDIIVPIPPGGGTDLTARITAAYLNKKWGVPVNVINKPGGNAIPGLMEVYKARPDGYTVLADAPTTSSMTSVSAKDLPIKVLDRTFLGIGYTMPYLFFVHVSSPWKTLADVIADAKQDPGNFTWTSMGGFAGQDVHMRQFAAAIGVDISKTKPVLARGGPDFTRLVAGNHVKLGSNTPATILSAVKSGLVRGIAITGKQRHPSHPDVPTFAELGYPTIDVIEWKGYSSTPGIPQNVIDLWGTTLEEMLKDPAVVSKAEAIGALPDFRNSDDTRKHVEKEMEQFGKLWRE